MWAGIVVKAREEVDSRHDLYNAPWRSGNPQFIPTERALKK